MDEGGDRIHHGMLCLDAALALPLVLRPDILRELPHLTRVRAYIEPSNSF